MATARILPSGSWRVRVFAGMESGKKIYKSFTAPPNKKLSLWLQNTCLSVKKRSCSCPVHYLGIQTKSKRDFDSINKKNINDITQHDIQLLINKKASRVSPKTVKNIHGLISAVFRMFRPNMALNTTLPQNQPKNMYIPTDSDIQKILECARDDEDMLIAILLAAFGPLCRSEIYGVEDTDIDKKHVLHIKCSFFFNV